MKTFGGDLLADKTFKKIISIGYEFETTELSKLSLHQNKRTLINSDIAPRVLEEREERESIKKVDENYISVRIPIGVDIEKIEEEYADAERPDGITDEEFEDYDRNRILEKWAKKENESYLDYFYEYRDGDDRDAISFQITNDLSDGAFGAMLKSICEGIDKPKNDIYFFKSKKGTLLDIKFSEKIAEQKVCETFSGVEFVVTYYNPKKENPNVILDTFVDALSRIVDHFGDVKLIHGSLLVDEGNKKLNTVGFLDGTRGLFHKPGTNLYYLQTYDSFDTVDEDEVLHIETLGDVVFAPQMTFKSKAEDALDIMKECLNAPPGYKVGKSTIVDQKKYLKRFLSIEKLVDALFHKYTETTEHKIDITKGMGKILKTYAFLIIFKLFMFFEGHIKIFSGEDYLKDHLYFNSRHGNSDLYDRIKEIFEEEYELDGVTEAQTLFENTEVLAPFFANELRNGAKSKIYKSDYVDGKYKYGDDFYKIDLPESNENYGNPLYSVKSYFKYLETKNEDWLKDAKYDTYSTSFSLDGDEILIENRWFRYMISSYLRNKVDSKIPDTYLSLNDMLKITGKIYPRDKIKKMRTLEWNPYKEKLSKKCGPGYHRNINFECKKNKLKKKAKKTLKILKKLKTLKKKNKKGLKPSTASRDKSRSNKSKSKTRSKSRQLSRSHTRSRTRNSNK